MGKETKVRHSKTKRDDIHRDRKKNKETKTGSEKKYIMESESGTRQRSSDRDRQIDTEMSADGHIIIEKMRV